LLGIRTANNGFSSQSEEMKTAFSIMQTMTINPFQNLVLNTITAALDEGGYKGSELYFEQLTPLAILSQQAEETDKTITQVEDETNKSMENPITQEEGTDNISQMSSEEELILASYPHFSKHFEVYKNK
jgi:hypothetical protein